MLLKSCFCTASRIINRSLQPSQINNVNRCILNTTKISPRVVWFSSHKSSLEDDRSTPKEIYYGILTPQIKAVKVFSLSSSLVGIIGQPFLYKAVVSTGNVPVIVACYSFIGFFTFVTPFLLHLITKKYVTHLAYKADTDTYIAKTVNFFCITKEVEFKTDDVKVPDVPGMFTTLVVNGKSLFFDPRSFENPEHYAKIMGYDKPVDFKLYETPPEKKG